MFAVRQGVGSMTPDSCHDSMEMRTKAGKANKDGGDKIVRRELASVFTNGTVVDPAFLAGDEASHCVAIKVSAFHASPQ